MSRLITFHKFHVPFLDAAPKLYTWEITDVKCMETKASRLPVPNHETTFHLDYGNQIGLSQYLERNSRRYSSTVALTDFLVLLIHNLNTLYVCTWTINCCLYYFTISSNNELVKHYTGLTDELVQLLTHATDSQPIQYYLGWLVKCLPSKEQLLSKLKCGLTHMIWEWGSVSVRKQWEKVQCISKTEPNSCHYQAHTYLLCWTINRDDFHIHTGRWVCICEWVSE